jgi:hypothetical protein
MPALRQGPPPRALELFDREVLRFTAGNRLRVQPLLTPDN